jgi:hypothetical protein
MCMGQFWSAAQAGPGLTTQHDAGDCGQRRCHGGAGSGPANFDLLTTRGAIGA